MIRYALILTGIAIVLLLPIGSNSAGRRGVVVSGPRGNSQPAPTASSSQSGDNLRVYVLTFGPGDDPWEKWGHNAIEIQEVDSNPYVAVASAEGTGASAPIITFDRMYNWGE